MNNFWTLKLTDGDCCLFNLNDVYFVKLRKVVEKKRFRSPKISGQLEIGLKEKYPIHANDDYEYLKDLFTELHQLLNGLEA